MSKSDYKRVWRSESRIKGAVETSGTLGGKGDAHVHVNRVHRDGTAEVAAGWGTSYRNPAQQLAQALNAALDPTTAPGKVRVYTQEEREALARERGVEPGAPAVRRKGWWFAPAQPGPPRPCPRCGGEIVPGVGLYHVAKSWLCCPTPAEEIACKLAVRRDHDAKRGKLQHGKVRYQGPVVRNKSVNAVRVRKK